MRKNYQENIQKIGIPWIPIVDTVKFSSRQNLSLMGHRDCMKERLKVGVSRLNIFGNFVEILH